jgi:predicted ATPase
LAEPVLVGRESELDELQHHLDFAVRGKGTTVFVSGEAGTGKTRLIKEFLNSGMRALIGGCVWLLTC